MRQSLEIAIALKLSADSGHQRISLPLEDRSLKLLPHPYRLLGGDVAGYESIGYPGPPSLPSPIQRIEALDELADFTDHNIQRVMREVDQKDLTLALLRADEATKAKVLSNMSKRVRTFIEEEMERRKEESPDTIDAAQKRIVEIVCDMA
jgi:hypothetical protein